MTGLLVSVRNLQEARIAVAAGASLIDIKEPERGPLGAADPQQWWAVYRAVGQQVPISIALGELVEWDAKLAVDVPPVAYAKVGLSGCARCPEWTRHWTDSLATLSHDVTPVAVCYADHCPADAPDMDQVLTAAAGARCRAVLWDTWKKGDGRLFDYLPVDRLRCAIQTVHNRGMVAALAGSLTIEDVAAVRSLNADWMAVRGAACEGGRSGGLSSDRVQRLAAALSTGASRRLTARSLSETADRFA